MSKHVLAQQARLMTGNVETHQQVAEIAARLQAQLDEALTCEDPTVAQALLPAAVRAVSVAAQQLVGGGLVPGSIWFDQAQRQLFTKAEQLLGPGQGIVQRPHHEPLPSAGPAGPRWR